MTGTVAKDLAAAVRLLVIARDRDECVLGRPDLSIYVAVPEPGAVLVEALRAGDTLAAATARASEVAGADVDGQDFLDGLAAAGLLDTAGQVGTPARTRQIRWIEGVSPRVAGRLFGPVGWTCYGVAAAFAVGVLLVRPDLRPSFEQDWWLPDPVLSVLLLVPIWLAASAIHEAWHWLAGRAVGVPAVFRISYLGAFLVVETDLTQIVTVPRRRRYGPFLAGMAIDSVWLALALALRLADRAGVLALPDLLGRLLAALVLLLSYGIVWQFAAVFLRSDMYAVLANTLHCNDLYRATWLTTKDRLWRLTDVERAEFDAIGDHDRAVARWFGVVYLAGLLVVGWTVLDLVVSFVIGMLIWIQGTLAGADLGSATFWESVAAAVVIVGQAVAPALLAVRERRLRRRGGLR
jgi:hypothetical protein